MLTKAHKAVKGSQWRATGGDWYGCDLFTDAVEVGSEQGEVLNIHNSIAV